MTRHDEEEVARHYARGSLIAAIAAGLAALGKTTDSLTIDDLAPVDEFHIGGRKATEDFLAQLALSPQHHVLDIGCGIGGAARFVATRYGSRVSGVDLTGEYVEAGNTLCAWLALDDRVSLQRGSALSLPFGDRAFDAAYMFHVGMNIRDKARLGVEVARVLRPGALFGIYDIMRVGAGELDYPLPWATTADTSAVAEPESYKQALQMAGFALVAERNRRDFALACFEELRARAAASGGPPPLGLHLLMGEDGLAKVQNMMRNVAAGRVAPVELIARRE